MFKWLLPLVFLHVLWRNMTHAFIPILLVKKLTQWSSSSCQVKIWGHLWLMSLPPYLWKVRCFTIFNLCCGCWPMVSICLFILVGKPECPVRSISFSGILPSTVISLCLYINQPPNFLILCSCVTGPQGWTNSHSECGYQDWLWYWRWQTGSHVQRVYPTKCKSSVE